MRRALVLVAVVVLGGCAKRDFGGLCKLATEILTEPRIKPPQRFERFLRDGPNHAFGKSARAVIAALPNVPPAERYDFVRAAASAEDLGDWSCPALPAVLNPPDEKSD